MRVYSKNGELTIKDTGTSIDVLYRMKYKDNNIVYDFKLIDEIKMNDIFVIVHGLGVKQIMVGNKVLNKRCSRLKLPKIYVSENGDRFDRDVIRLYEKYAS